MKFIAGCRYNATHFGKLLPNWLYVIDRTAKMLTCERGTMPGNKRIKIRRIDETECLTPVPNVLVLATDIYSTKRNAMQYVIKQVSPEGSFYWSGKDYSEDINDAQYYNAHFDAHTALQELDAEDQYNTVIIGVET